MRAPDLIAAPAGVQELPDAPLPPQEQPIPALPPRGFSDEPIDLREVPGGW
jgi:hypothetical protein